MRQVHLNALRHIDMNAGTRIVELATRAGVTKGAMSQIVDDCLSLGLVELSVDPSDKRARLVRFSERGYAFTEVTRQSVSAIEREFAERIGASAFAAFRGELLALRREFAPSPTDDTR